MPKRVDHEVRKADISDALVRLAGREGLHSVTMRSVASEARVSLRLVQYYFGTKDRLVDFALRRLEAQSNERWDSRMEGLSPPVSSRALIEAFLAEALPTDEESRNFHLIWSSLALISVTDDGTPGETLVRGPDSLESRLSEILAAESDNRPDMAFDPNKESARLAALTHGLGTAILVGQRTEREVWEVLGYHLDKLFGASGESVR